MLPVWPIRKASLLFRPTSSGIGARMIDMFSLEKWHFYLHTSINWQCARHCANFDHRFGKRVKNVLLVRPEFGHKYIQRLYFTSEKRFLLPTLQWRLTRLCILCYSCKKWGPLEVFNESKSNGARSGVKKENKLVDKKKVATANMSMRALTVWVAKGQCIRFTTP